MSEAAAVDVKNLVKDFKGPFRGKKVQAVRDVSLSIAPGEVYGRSLGRILRRWTREGRWVFCRRILIFISI